MSLPFLHSQNATPRGKSMTSRLTTSLLAAACAVVPGAAMLAMPATAQSVQRPANEVVLSIGRGQLVTTGGRMADVFVANDQVADVQIKSERQLYIFGKAGGETTVYASDAGGAIIWSATVRVGSNIESIDQMLSLAMPEAKVAVSTMGTNTVLLTGTVASPEEAAEAQRLVKAYVGDNTNVITRLRTATPLQVNLQVRFAEVSRSFVKSLGMNFQTVDQTSGMKIVLGQGRAFSPQYVPGGPLGTGTSGPDNGSVITPISNGTTLGFARKFLGLDLIGALDAGETTGLVSTLAQPNLTALSGETADFLAGGEYPIPISQGLGSTSIEYKKYGVSLAYTPTVLSNGRISLRVRPEVSELSSQGAVNLNGFTVPALTIRRTETTVELGSGQSFMIAGLLSNNSQNTIQKMPGAGDLPILGSLFRSTGFRKGETELVIVVTPYLVKPVNAAEIKLPTDGYNAPNELQRILGNMESDGVTGGDRPKPRADGAAPPNPKVGLIDEPAPAAPAPKRKGRSSRQAAAAPTPGFNLD